MGFLLENIEQEDFHCVVEGLIYAISKGMKEEAEFIAKHPEFQDKVKSIITRSRTRSRTLLLTFL